MENSTLDKSESYEEQNFYRFINNYLPWLDVLKIQGAKGWPDKAVFIGTGQVIFFEFKKKKTGRLSDAQKLRIESLRIKGYKVFIVTEAPEAIKNLMEVLTDDL